MMKALLCMVLFMGSSAQAQDEAFTNHWVEIGNEASNHQILDIRDISVIDKDEMVSLNELLAQPGKTKAVIQVVELLPSGSICRGCLNKGSSILRSLWANPGLSAETTYIMVLSANYTPSANHVRFAEHYTLRGMKVVRDINGTLQNTFARGNYPVTLVLESKYRGKVLNMHGQQPQTVIRTLANLPNE